MRSDLVDLSPVLVALRRRRPPAAARAGFPAGRRQRPVRRPRAAHPVLGLRRAGARDGAQRRRARQRDDWRVRSVGLRLSSHAGLRRHLHAAIAARCRAVVPAIIACSLLFFVVSNVAVWAFSGMYPLTAAGLATVLRRGAAVPREDRDRRPVLGGRAVRRRLAGAARPARWRAAPPNPADNAVSVRQRLRDRARPG